MSNPDTYRIYPPTEKVFATPEGLSHFFGYYYYSPLHQDEKRLLAHRCAFDGRKVEASDRAEIGYFNLYDGSWHALGHTRAFNWQQGSMLHWHSEHSIAFNDREADRFVCRIADAETGKIIRNLPRAISMESPDGKHAICTNWERIYYCRPGYNYQGIEKPEWDRPLHPEDGLFHMDMESGEVSRILRTADFSEDPECPQWLEHPIIAPDSRRFLFLHRFVRNEAIVTRLYTCDMDGRNLHAYPHFSFYSHAAWLNEREFCIFGREQTRKALEQYTRHRNGLLRPLRPLLRAARKHLIPHKIQKTALGGHYYIFDDTTQQYAPLPSEAPPEDGHPSWTRNQRYMLTDTYQDYKNERHLLIYDRQENKTQKLASFHSTYNNSSYRCDLHPRFSPDQKLIIIDAAQQPRRQIMLLRHQAF